MQKLPLYSASAEHTATKYANSFDVVYHQTIWFVVLNVSQCHETGPVSCKLACLPDESYE